MQSSVATLGHEQAGGPRYVRERHVDDTGLPHVREYGPVATTQAAADARAAAHAALLDADLAEAEVDHCLATGAIRTQYQTAAQFAARLRARYRAANGERAARIAEWIIDRVTSGQLTDDQVRTAFGLTNPQYTALKTRLTNLRAQWIGVRDAAGE